KLERSRRALVCGGLPLLTLSGRRGSKLPAARSALLNHLVGGGEQRLWDDEANALAVLRLTTSFRPRRWPRAQAANSVPTYLNPVTPRAAAVKDGPLGRRRRRRAAGEHGVTLAVVGIAAMSRCCGVTRV